MNECPDPDLSEPASPRAAGWSHPALHLVLLAGVTAVYLALSWRKWADPVVDFGRELYIPWRLAQGAVLYRDVEDFYGPLSHYLNAGLFRLFGPGIMTLVTANLVVFAAIVVAVYFLLRRAWGAGAALGAAAGFIAIFGFSRFVYVGNFNYATPYAHEATHGVLVLLGLTAVLAAWLERPTRGRAAAAGLLAGLTCVLKAEIMLPAGLLLLTAWALRGRRGDPVERSQVLAAAAAALVPTLAFVLWFGRELPWREAWSAAGRAWWNVIATTRYVSDPAQFAYSGLDQPWRNLGTQALATVVAAGGLGLLALPAWLWERRSKWRGAAPAAVVLIVVLAGAACLPTDAHWLQAGSCFFGLLALYLGWTGWCGWRQPAGTGRFGPAGELRLLLAVLALGLMARMVLAGRIYQYGFYQAGLAGAVLTAAALGEWPRRVAATSGGRRLAVIGVMLVLVPAGLLLSLRNAAAYRQMTVSLGTGPDRFLAYPGSAPVAQVAEALRTVPAGQTLLVLPEGLMLNYLARMPAPTPHFFYYSAVTENGAERELVRRLVAQPPGFIVTLPRDLREYGIGTYGERSGAGGDILAWMKNGYTLRAWVRGSYAGPAPADGVVAYSNDYVQVFARKPVSEK